MVIAQYISIKLQYKHSDRRGEDFYFVNFVCVVVTHFNPLIPQGALLPDSVGHFPPPPSPNFLVHES